MDFVALPPPRPAKPSLRHPLVGVFAEQMFPLEEPSPTPPSSVDDPPTRDLPRTSMGSPHPSRVEARRFFDPASGWYRGLERRVSNGLSRHVLPRIPGIDRPYSWLLNRWLTVSEAEVGLQSLSSSLDGTKVLLLTDVHAGPFVSPARLASTFARLLALRPDLILLGGDLTTTSLEELQRSNAAFQCLRAPLGVFAVLGNHDHYTGDPPSVRRELAASGIRTLHNDGVMVGGADGLFLAGIDDLIEGDPDLDRALLAKPRGAPTILLSHNPDILVAAAARRLALVLSGHTHGGQVRIPGLPVLVRQSRFGLDEGRYELDGCQLIVSRGLGATGLPLRLACPPEAVLLTLRSL